VPSAAALRLQIESSLERRFPAALTPMPRTIRETAATGIAEVDRLLEGGLPVGAISEITGPVGSGRTSLAHAFLAARTQEERVCAWVDAHDAFDAESAAACGVALRRLLWVRLKNGPNASASARGFASPQRWPAKPSSVHPAALPFARQDFAYLDHALRATDLLLQAGGFSALVLDLGSTTPEQGCRIPLATWFRFRQAADRTRCSLLVLAQQPLAQSSAAVVLTCARRQVRSAGQTVLTGCTYEIGTGRQRFAPGQSMPHLASQRKPPASTWTASAASPTARPNSTARRGEATA
jgi:recombination protein RecA